MYCLILFQYMKQLNIRIPLVYAEHWNQGDQFPVSQKVKETLHRFLAYKQTQLTNIEHNSAQFLT